MLKEQTVYPLLPFLQNWKEWVFLDKQVEGMSKHKEFYVTPSHTNKVFANMKREGKSFPGRDTPLFPTMMVQAQQEEGEADEAANEEHIPTHSNDPLLSGEDRLQLNELMEICTNLQKKVLDLETSKAAQAHEISSLKQRVKKLEKKKTSRPHGLRRLYKGRKIANLDVDAEVTLIDESQRRNKDLMFDTGVLDGDEVFVETEEPVVNAATTTSSIPVSVDDPVTTAGEVVTTASVEIPDELTLAQTLIEIKTSKPKAITTSTTIVTPVRPRAKGIIFHDQEEQAPASTTIVSSSQSQLPQAKDKGKAKMVEPEIPLKKKDQIAFDEEVTKRLEAKMQAELEEEERVAKQREEEANLISWDNTQAMMEANYELAQRLQAEEQGELTIEERSKLFVELMDKRKKHFAKLRAEEIRRKPPTKAQNRNQMCTYLKNMANYKHSQLKNKSFKEIQMLFDNNMKWIDSFVPMDSEVVEGSKTRIEGSSKRAGIELEQEVAKKQKLDKNKEAEVDDDQEEAEMKKHMEIVIDEEITFDAIPLATKPPTIVD
ncbi:hypothetical protein Tco_1315529 [Tanacetum coccineum]